MRLVAFHFASGDTFFTGCVLILLACLIGLRNPSRRVGAAGRLLGRVGIVFVALSATPLPYGFYAAWAFLVIAASFARRRTAAANGPGRRARALTAVAILVTLGAVAWELLWRFPDAVPEREMPTLSVIGDSLSAGMDPDREQTWPKVLRDEYGVNVADCSRMGATARSALKQADHLPAGASVVLLEIGGNDLLGETSAKQFAEDLDALLAKVSRPERRLVMLELPLPPFHNAFGRAQRSLAERYGVLLIPKREFARVIFASGMTLDGLHFSEDGHRRMAAMVMRRVGSSLATGAQPDENAR